MSIRATIVLMFIGSLGWPAPRAFAQSSGGDLEKWEIEIHAGGLWPGQSTKATTAMPPAGTDFTAPNGRPTRSVSSWYFGDGAVLLNDWAAAFTTIPRTQRITPLDSMLNGTAVKHSDGASFGIRVGRRLTPRFTVELNVDYGKSTLQLSDQALDDIEASRATFANVFNEQFNPALGGFVNSVVSSQSEIDEGTGGQIAAIGALKMTIKRVGPLVPYVTGGLGSVFHYGRAPGVTLRGSYSMSPAFNPAVVFNETDTVTVRFARPDSAFAGIAGGGFTLNVSRRSGVRIDMRWHFTANAIETEVNASPFVAKGTPAASLGSATTPTVVFTNNVNLLSSLSGPAITSFKTREGSGMQIDPVLTAGYFWRF